MEFLINGQWQECKLNFLEETIQILEEHNKSSDDIRWIGLKDGSKYLLYWVEFSSIADFEYDDSFGSVKINKNLVIVGSNWWLERQEYDGSEWWTFNKQPTTKRKRTTLEFEDLLEKS